MKALLILACLLAVAAAKTEFTAEHVEELTSKNFVEKTTDGKLYFIKFYAPWCGHCKKLAPTWAELAAAYKDNNDVVIAHIDCTTSKDICTKAEVKGYPTLKIYFNGEEHKAFKGQRNMDGLKAFADSAFKELFSETTT